MCRILFLKGTNTTKAIEFVQSFKQSGVCDLRFGKLTKELGIDSLSDQHIHGWGYLLVTKTGVSNYLTSTFIRDDIVGFEKFINEIKNIQGEFIVFAEIRVTGEGYISAFNSHPFFFSNIKGFDGYLFHNGFLDGKVIAQELGINTDDYKTKNDSVFIAHLISKNLAEGKSMKEAIYVPDGAINTTYNIMIFLHDNQGKYKAYIYPHINSKGLEADYIYDCNKLLRYESEDLVYIGSSTISDYLNEDYIEVENNKLIEFEIDFIEEYEFTDKK